MDCFAIKQCNFQRCDKLSLTFLALKEKASKLLKACGIYNVAFFSLKIRLLSTALHRYDLKIVFSFNLITDFHRCLPKKCMSIFGKKQILK